MKSSRNEREGFRTFVAEDRGIKERILLAVGTTIVERPRNLQLSVDADEHSITHTLYRLNRDGLLQFKTRKNLHSTGMNLTKIRLTKQGIRKYEALRHG
jgi:hypothetical protein